MPYFRSLSKIRIQLAARRLRIAVFAIGVSQLAVAPSAEALLDFGPAQPITSRASLDDQNAFNADTAAAVATDGLGNWVVVWRSYDSLDAQLPGGNVANLVVVRSSDNGASWSDPDPVVPGGMDQVVSDYALATDKLGTWLIVYGDGKILRSIDNGALWSVAYESPNYTNERTTSAALAVDSDGNWVAAYVRSNPSPGQFGLQTDLYWIRSTDGGMSWSAEQQVDPGSPASADADYRPVLVPGDGGEWSVLWINGGEPERIRIARSNDDGASFSTGAPLDDGNCPNILSFDVLRVSETRWIVTRDCFRGVANPRLVGTAVSNDGGLTLSSFAEFGEGFRPVLAGGLDDNVYLVRGSWDSLLGAIDQDADIVVRRSNDGGDSWTDDYAATGAARLDNHITGVDSLESGAVATDGHGNWVLVYSSSFTYVKDQGSDADVGEDRDIFFARGGELCPPAPIAGCRETTVSGGGQLTITDKPGGKDKLTWKLKRSDASLVDDFRVSGSDGRLTFCLYDDPGPDQRLVFEKSIVGEAVTKRGDPAWSLSSDRWRYKDSILRNSAVAAAQFSAGADGKAAIKLSARGPSLGLPILPMASGPIVAQFHSEDSGACWNTTLGNILKHSSSKFKAKTN